MSQSIKAIRHDHQDPQIAQQRALWAAGNYADIGMRLQIVGEQLAEYTDVAPGERVLDVAAGNGNFALAAARRFAVVTSSDIVPALVEQARIRTLAEGMVISHQVANAECLPFEDAQFDLVGSVFGVMFTQDHACAATELQRVCRPGGRITFAAWTPEGFIGRLFATLGPFKSAAGGPSPMRWGTEDHLMTLFPNAQSVRVQKAIYTFRYTRTDAWVDYFSAAYGPLVTLIAQLDASRKRKLREALIALCDAHTISSSHMAIPAEYLQVEIVPAAKDPS